MSKNWRLIVEEKFEHFSDFIYDNAKVVLAAVFIAFFLLASNLTKITVDTSTEGFLHKTDPYRVAYDKFREQYGRDEKLIIAIKTDNIFDKGFLEKLKQFHQEIESSVPYIDDVNSLINARKTVGEENTLIVEDLLEEIPDDLSAIKAFTLNNPFYKNLLISEDGTFTTLVIDTLTYSLAKETEVTDDFSEGFTEETENVQEREFLTDAENSTIVHKIREIISKYETKSDTFYFAGSPVITDTLKRAMMSDMQKFILMILAVIAVMLFVMFRRISGIVLPLTTVMITLIMTISLMALFGKPITVLTQIMPSFLLAVGVGASIHLLAIFYYRLDHIKDKKKALSYTIGHSGLAIVMTSVTTAASLFTFAYSQIAPVEDIGLYASTGVFISLVLTLVFIPALISLLPIKQKEGHKEHHGRIDLILEWFAKTSVTHPKKIVGIGMMTVVVTLLLSSSIHFSHNPLAWFKKDSQIRQDTAVIDHNLKGSVSLELIIDTKKENGIYDPKLLQAIEKTAREIAGLKSDAYFVGKVVSIVDILKEINQALNEGQKSFYTIPDSKDLIAQEFLLFENSGSDDLEAIVDTTFSQTRVSVKVPWIDAIEYLGLLSGVEESLNKNFGSSAEVTITGLIPMMVRTIDAAIVSSAESYVLAFIVIAILMVLLIGDVKLGLISMIPNLVPIIFGMAVMIVFDIPLDMFTILIGTIAIGLAVDDTIHFMHNYKRYMLTHKSVDRAIMLTLTSTGRAMFSTSVVLATGFFIFMFASMNNLFNFGLLTGIVIIVALLCDFLLSPALLKLITKESK